MNTQKAIQKKFMHIYSIKKYNNITVKEVCLNTPVARTTFYSYYQNLNDVMNEIENSLIKGILQIATNISNGNIRSMDFSIFLSQTMEYIENNKSEIYAFLITQPNIRFILKWKKAIKKHFSLRFPDNKNAVNYELISETIASGVIGAYSYWLKNPENVNIDSLNLIVTSIVNNLTKTI